MIKAIDRLFERLGATYGTAWTHSLGDSPINDVKSVWGHELLIFKSSLFRVAWALENLPERCPNIIQFKNLCRQAPAPETLALPEPKADPARVAAELAKLDEMKVKKSESHNSFKDWAYRLKKRHAAGDRLSSYQIMCYQMALKASI